MLSVTFTFNLGEFRIVKLTRIALAEKTKDAEIFEEIPKIYDGHENTPLVDMRCAIQCCIGVVPALQRRYRLGISVYTF